MLGGRRRTAEVGRAGARGPYFGKLQVVPQFAIRDLRDLDVCQALGIEEACGAIGQANARGYEPGKWNMVAVVSNGNAVRQREGGPVGALPVVEGRALLFRYVAGINAVPLCLNVCEPEEIVRVVKAVEPSFGGIDLTAIEWPQGYEVLERLARELEIPVAHDPQRGAAVIALATLINAARVVGKSLSSLRVTVLGTGAASLYLVRLMVTAGILPGNIHVADRKGLLHRERDDLKETARPKWELCELTNVDNLSGGVAVALYSSDAVVTLSIPISRVVQPEWVKTMARDPILISCANTPAAWVAEALEAGARIVATTPSQSPGGIFGFMILPAVFRGALDVRATAISDEMYVAVAWELAQRVGTGGLSKDRLLPDMRDMELYAHLATAAGRQAVEQGLARLDLESADLLSRARGVAEQARTMARVLVESGLLPDYTE